MRGVVDGVGERRAHQPGGGDRAVEPRARHHLDDGRDAAALLADQPRRARLRTRPRRRHSSGCRACPSGAGRQRVDAAVGQEARHQEAGEPARRLRQHQEGVAHGRRHEPLVAGDRGIRRPARRCRRARPSSSLARTSVPPCFSVMPMPMVTPRFSAAGAKLLSYSRDRIFGTHSLGELRLEQQRRHGGVGHGDRAAGARPPSASPCRSRPRAPRWRPARGLVPASARWSQTEQCRPSLHAQRHALVVGGVELDRVAAGGPGVEGLEAAAGARWRAGRARAPLRCPQARRRPCSRFDRVAAALALDRLHQRRGRR